jgi:hypothetical protein
VCTICIKGVTGQMSDFLLFCCIHEANMIDQRWLNKKLSFELSIGPYGGSSLASVYDDKAVKAKKANGNVSGASSIVDMVSLMGDTPPVDDAVDVSTALCTSADGRAMWHCRTPPERPTLTCVDSL